MNQNPRSLIVRAVAAATALACTGQAHAEWVELETFEVEPHSLEGPDPGFVIADPSDPSNHVLETPVAEGTLRRPLAEGEFIPEGTTGTFFFQSVVPSIAQEGLPPYDHWPDTLVGLTDEDVGQNWPDYLGYGGWVHNPETEFFVRDGDGAGGGSNISVFAALERNAKYNTWLVYDGENGSYDVYLEGPGTDGQELVADDFFFRRTFAPGDIDNIQIKEGGFGEDPIYLDNLFIDPAGENLTMPPIGGGDQPPFEVTAINYDDTIGEVTLVFLSTPGTSYVVDYSDDLAAWTTSEVTVTATEATTTVSFDGAPANAPGGDRNFRVSVVP